MSCYGSGALAEVDASPRAGEEAQARSFGQRLRATRLHAGLSQSALEGRSGIPKARLSRYENGHVVPSTETLGRLARALECSEASLLGDPRAATQEFVEVLFRRGVRMFSPEQAVKVANAVADILEAAAPPVQLPEADSTSMVTVQVAASPSASTPVPPA